MTRNSRPVACRKALRRWKLWWIGEVKFIDEQYLSFIVEKYDQDYRFVLRTLLLYF